MPALPNVPQMLRITFTHKWGTDIDAVVRQFFTYTGGAPLNNDCNTMAQAIGGFWVQRFASLCTSFTSLTQVSVVDLTSPTAGQAAVVMSHPGTNPGNELPAGACLLVNALIGRRYRGGKPRSYWPIGTQAMLQDPQHWTPASVTNFQTAVNGLQSDIRSVVAGSTQISGQFNVGYYGGVNPPITLPSGRVKQSNKVLPAANRDAITSLVVNPIVGSQRRRYTR